LSESECSEFKNEQNDIITRTDEIALTDKAVSLASNSVGQRPTKEGNVFVVSPERAKSNGVNDLELKIKS
jgi:hypothetical protein